MLHVCFVPSRVISISCVLLASIYLFINGNSKSELSRGGKAELWNAVFVKSQESLVSRAAREFTPDLVEPSPQLCSEANDFF